MVFKKYGLLLALTCFAYQAKSQWYDPEKVTAKVQLVYSGAIQALRDAEWNEAGTLLRKAIKMEPKFVEGWLSLGGMYGQLKQYDSAVYCYQKAWEMDSIFSNELQIPWSMNLAGVGRFAEAKQMIDRLLANPATDKRVLKDAQFRLNTYQFAVDFEKKHGRQENFHPKNLGDSINSTYSEYYPSFTIDDSIFVFTRRGKGIREDFIKSEKAGNGYHLAKPVEGQLNDEPSKGGISISQDGEWLLFAGNFSRQGFGDFDIYMSTATPQGWSDPYNLGENINTEFWESSPSISPDKQTLYFSSNRPGGFGGKDLYVSHRQPNGSWGVAENMGENFNTAADDLAPFIHSDNQTLYFTSGGHPGYGGSDIYVSRKGPDGQWTVPENLGYPINTIGDEGSMMVTADGKTAYYAANGSDTRGGLDLYSFELPEFARPKRTLWVKGQVVNATNSRGLPSAIELKDIKTGALVEKVVTDETGNYLVTLPVGSDYTFTVNRKGFLFYSDHFLLGSKPSDSTYRKDIALQPIAVNTALELKNILFETNSFTLDPLSFTELDKVVQLLKDNPGLKVQIKGHTDNVGTPSANLALSSNRAKSVVGYITSKGIEAARLSFKGYGSALPVAANNSEEGRARNRRTELVVTGI
jgi:tetratricopeptide (TPR) repeat protein